MDDRATGGTREFYAPRPAASPLRVLLRGVERGLVFLLSVRIFVRMSPRKPRSPCLACGKPLKNLRSRYCDNRCQGTFQREKYLAAWKAGEKSGTSDVSNPEIIGVRGIIRTYLFEKFDGKCTRCGWGEKHPVTGRSPLQVDHRDGNVLNNREENLDLLCPNCHSLTPTWGNLNRGNGRKAQIKKAGP